MPITNPQHTQQNVETGQPPAGADAGLKLAAIKPGSTIDAGPDGERRTKSGKFTLAQLRQTDGIVPLQSGTNQYDSQRGKTGFGMPRNTQTRVEFADVGKRWSVNALSIQDTQIRLQSGTNQFDSQRGMTGFGAPRDVKGKHLKRIWELEFPEEALTDQPPVNLAPQQIQNQQAQQQSQQQFQQQSQQQARQQTQQQAQQQRSGPPAPPKNLAGPSFR